MIITFVVKKQRSDNAKLKKKRLHLRLFRDRTVWRKWVNYRKYPSKRNRRFHVVRDGDPFVYVDLILDSGKKRKCLLLLRNVIRRQFHSAENVVKREIDWIRNDVTRRKCILENLLQYTLAEFNNDEIINNFALGIFLF